MRKRLSVEALTERYGVRKAIEFNMQDFLAICAFEGWKETNNDYHYDHKVYGAKTYSQGCVTFIVNKLMTDIPYLSLVRRKYNESNVKKGTAKKKAAELA
ncbi:MAG: hypothetical protein IPL77_09395 [Flavobacteriales bacterium]|nr:hypothetical protein [Flavobacteriales bacterium]